MVDIYRRGFNTYTYIILLCSNLIRLNNLNQLECEIPINFVYCTSYLKINKFMINSCHNIIPYIPIAEIYFKLMQQYCTPKNTWNWLLDLKAKAFASFHILIIDIIYLLYL
jgi:hypothetical protein